MDEDVFLFWQIVVSIISLIVLITYFITAHRIKRIKELLYDKKLDHYKMYWYERNLGNYDEAYRHLLLIYLDDMYKYHHEAETGMPTNKKQELIAQMCEAINKPVPDFKTFGVEV